MKKIKIFFMLFPRLTFDFQIAMFEPVGPFMLTGRRYASPLVLQM